MKNLTLFWGIITLFIIVAVSFAHLFFKEPKPLVIFAGGGSVYKYLESKGINIEGPEHFPNSVYSNMPSGYVKPLLIEEIQRFGKENGSKHPFLNISLLNKKIVDKNIESRSPFLYIGLSAKKIDYHPLFNSEYAQVYEYNIGKDSLAVYYVVDKKDQYLYKDYNIDTLVEDLRYFSKNNTIYTATPESGTRKAYDSIINNIKDNKELKVILDSAKNFFKDKIIPTNGIVLSSEYYPPVIDNKKVTIKYILKEEVPKDLYIYFVGYKSHDNIYKPNSQVIEFLNQCVNKIHPSKKNYFLEDSIWEIESSDRNKIKEINLTK